MAPRCTCPALCVPSGLALELCSQGLLIRSAHWWHLAAFLIGCCTHAWRTHLLRDIVPLLAGAHHVGVCVLDAAGAADLQAGRQPKGAELLARCQARPTRLAQFGPQKQQPAKRHVAISNRPWMAGIRRDVSPSQARLCTKCSCMQHAASTHLQVVDASSGEIGTGGLEPHAAVNRCLHNKRAARALQCRDRSRHGVSLWLRCCGQAASQAFRSPCPAHQEQWPSYQGQEPCSRTVSSNTKSSFMILWCCSALLWPALLTMAAQ